MDPPGHAFDIVRHMQAGLYVYRLEDRLHDESLLLVASNPAADRLTGLPSARILGKRIDECFPGLRAAGIPRVFAEVARTGTSRAFDHFLYADARVIERAWTFQAFALPDDHVGVLFEDVTERKRHTEDLRESESRFRALFEQTSDAVFIVSTHGEILAVNERASGLLGMRVPDLVGAPFERFVIPDQREHSREIIGDLHPGSVAPLYETILVRRDESRVPVEVGAALVLDESRGHRHVQIVVRDISERKMAEFALRESEERYRSLVEGAPEAIVLFHVDRDCFVDMNEKAVQLFGRERSELCRLGFANLGSPSTAPGRPSTDVLAAHVRRALRGESPQFEWMQIRPDGTVIPCEVSLVRLGSAGSRILRGSVLDISDRKQHQETLRQAQKLESLGVLAGGIAHDFNNLLVGILGNAGLALMDLPEANPTRALLYEIRDAAERAAELTQQMLAYAGKTRIEASNIDLNQLIEEMGRLLDTVISKKTQLVYDLGEPTALRGDVSQIRQVVMNLLTNASEALDEAAGTVTLRTQRTESTGPRPGEPLHAGDLEPGTYVTMEVEDTGCGMDEATRSRIFDPFFTTKFVGRGLGLAAVSGIVRSHGGTLVVESEPGKGTRFVVHLPASMEAAPPEPDPGPETDDSWIGDGTILVADDDRAVRRVICGVLERLGFDVVCATNGREAVEHVNDPEHRFRAVLLDLSMPVLSGEEAYEELRRTAPDLPVILLSGYSEDDLSARFSGRGLAGFIKKPFTTRTLRDRLRSALEP